MATKTTNPDLQPIDRNRKEDLTVEELKGIPCFSNLTDDKLSELLRTTKSYTKAILYMTQKQLAEGTQAPGKTVSIYINPQKKAA